jgi:cellulose synthase/poly-beta-1,6-N-acetylglucosamine synthase-like glycosyltransferase
VGLPSVNVLLPVLNECNHIDHCLESLAEQDYSGSYSILVADGGSTDGTVQRLEEWKRRIPSLGVIHNPGRVQSHGLNLAAAAARGDILIRADAHTTYARDYVRRSVEALLSSGATAVGGTQFPEGSSRFGSAVATAMRSPLAIGSASFRHATEATYADTVYLGAMRREDLVEIGFRTFPSRVAEDPDFYYRLRARGGTVLVDPTIRSTYRPRETPGALWRQFYRYGMGKVDMLYVNGRFPSWRPLGPLLLVIALAGAAAAAVAGTWWPAAILALLWLGVLAVAAGGRPLVMVAAAMMQLAYGLGLLRGFLRFPGRVRASVIS